jgi:hypothetical protein
MFRISVHFAATAGPQTPVAAHIILNRLEVQAMISDNGGIHMSWGVSGNEMFKRWGSK